MPLGYKHTEATKKKLSEISKITLNGFKKGHTCCWKGKKMPSRSEEWRIKQRKSQKGKPWSEKRRKAQELVRRKYTKKGKFLIKNGKEYSSNWNEIRKIIYKRDNWHCQECNIHCWSNGKSKIQCHHIDYNEKNNDFDNLITLCASCHAKTLYKRQDWVIYFHNKMGVLK
jgi:5-methylcytosine-specific restriction endonuclease McrA